MANCQYHMRRCNPFTIVKHHATNMARSRSIRFNIKTRHTLLKPNFATERLIRPEGTRSVSYELFVVGLDRRTGAAAAAG